MLEEWRKLANKYNRPDRIVLAIPSDAEQLPQLLSSKSAPDAGVLAYPCRGTVCLQSISNIDEFQEYLLDPAL